MAASQFPASHRDLLDASTAMLATVGPDGTPQVTAIAFTYYEAEDLIKISLNDRRQKARNLRRDPRVTLFILDPDNRYRTLEIRARAEFAPDPDFAFAKIAGSKYGKDFHDNDRPGETRSIVVFHPEHIVATDLTPARADRA
jgi:PPOX class probable F420-dependent enzyme